MKNEGDQELWDLMGQARHPEASAFFARNVVREVRQLEDGKSKLGLFSRLSRPLALVAAVVLIAATVGVVIHSNTLSDGGSTQVAKTSLETFDPAEEIASISMLGELMAVADPTSLSDEALLNLLY